MLIIPIEGSIEKSLKIFKKKFSKTGMVKEIRNRRYYIKPTVKNRALKIKAVYKQKLQDKGVIR